MANTKLSRPKSSDETKAKKYNEAFNADNELLNTDTYSTIGSNLVEDAKMSVRNVDVFYGDKQAIFDVNIDIKKNEVIAMIGPSGCGKSTFLRTLNRMNDTIDSCVVRGEVTMDGENLYDPKLDVVELGAGVGMEFQKPNLSHHLPKPDWHLPYS